MNRAAGILLSISSLPSKYGIGCFSKDAYEFVDWLKEVYFNKKGFYLEQTRCKECNKNCTLCSSVS